VNAPRTSIAATVLIVAAALGPEEAAARVVDGVAAVVGEEVITLSEVRDTAAPAVALARRIADARERERGLRQAWRDALDALIADRLLSQQVEELKIEVSDREVEAATADVARRNNLDEAGLRSVLERQGMTWERYREDLEKQLLRLKLIELKVRTRVTVSDDDIRNTYVHEFASPRRSREVRLQRILVKLPPTPLPADVAAAQARLDAAHKRLTAGEDFAAVARRHSDDTSAAQGGDLGWFKPGEMLPAFEEAVSDVATGGIAGPVRTPGGLNLLRVAERREAPVPPLEQVQDQIRAALYQQEVEKHLTRWVETLKGETFIEVKLDLARAEGGRGRDAQ
jgi:peptidyl-prolyl cis-trans isomerase SurA